MKQRCKWLLIAFRDLKYKEVAMSYTLEKLEIEEQPPAIKKSPDMRLQLITEEDAEDPLANRWSPTAC